MPEDTQVHQQEETQIPMHAHRCMACLAKGVNTVWVHGDNLAGDVASHKCPACGEIQWKKWMVEIGQLPRRIVPQNQKDFNTMLGYVMLAVGVAIVGYVAFLYIRAWKTERKIPKVLP